MDNLDWQLPQEPAAQPTQPPQPTEPPYVALSVVAAVPAPPWVMQGIHKEREKNTRIFTVLSVFLIAMMVMEGIYTLPDGGLSAYSLYTVVAALVTAGLWMLCAHFFFKNVNGPKLYSSYRVNKVYPQSVVSIGENGWVSISFKEATGFVETERWIALYSDTDEIVWSSADLSPSETGKLFTALATYLPENVFRRRNVFRPAKLFETPAPPTAFFESVTETIPAAFSMKHTVKTALFEMMKKAIPLFLLVGAIFANILCDGFGMFASYPLVGRIVFTLMGTVFCVITAGLLVFWEKAKLVKSRNKKGVNVLVTATTVRVKEDTKLTVIPKTNLRLTVDKQKTAHFPVGEDIVTVPYANYRGSTLETLSNK